jgi:fluoride exporter
MWSTVFVQSWHDGVFRWGALTVNFAGCLVVGALAGAGAVLPGSVFGLVGTGFCGASTTYSTFSYELCVWLSGKTASTRSSNVMVSVVAGAGTVLLACTTTSALVA